jgi:hypothetical protein
MARNTISIDDVVNEFVLLNDEDGYTSHATESVIRNFALRGVREMGFDIMKRIKSLKLTPNQSLNTVELPDDFVDWTKIGVIGSDGLIYVYGENKNISSTMSYKKDSNNNPIDSDGDGVNDRVDDKTLADSGDSVFKGYQSYIYRNYIYESTEGGIYGIGGGRYSGEFKVNYEQNRIELSLNSDVTEIAIEYIADEARSANPSVHIYAENALQSYIYYRLIERKAGVPMVEKQRARQEYYNERRLANSRMKSFTKEEAMKTINKNFKSTVKN